MSEIQIKKILLPIDGSESSIKAARYAVKIAKQEKAQIICIHAIGTPAYISEYRGPLLLPAYYDDIKKLAQEWFAKVIEIAKRENIDVKTDVLLDVVSVVDTIVNYATNENVDMIVIGTKGRTALKRFLLGSVANGVVLHAHCPVLVVR
jgi:nucleotide-binding universal stress UspA family protein